MKHLFTWSFIFGIGCVDMIKEMLAEPEEDEEDEDEDEERYEGQKQGDCLDGEDNDDDGLIDCEDDGCFDKPACEGVVDTGDTDEPVDTGDTEVEDPYAIDDDGDGWTEYDGDCDDSDPYTNPGAYDEPGDGIDQDCDGMDAYQDEDGDGWSPQDGDCDDYNPEVYPGAYDYPDDGIDQDCDGMDASDPLNTDDDGDAFTENEGDCDDSDPSIYPGAIEIPEDGIDQDCDGSDSSGSDCCYDLNMSDSYGDGWNGASLTLEVNGTSVDSFTISSSQGSSASDSFCVHYGDSFELLFSSGQYDSEISYVLQEDGTGTTVFSDSNPSTGVRYSGSCN